MITYPMQFKALSQSPSGTQTAWNSTLHPSEGATISSPVAIPPEFAGPGGGYSPEDFYLLALTNCFIATFKVIAEKSKLEFNEVLVDSALTVDRGEGGAPWMSAIHLKVNLIGAGDQERAQRLLEKTSQSCMILNSVKTVKTYEWCFG